MKFLEYIDYLLNLDNVEHFWNKYKFAFIGLLVVIFAGTAACTYYVQSVEKTAKADSVIVFNTILENSTKADYAKSITAALEEVNSQTAKDTLSLELAKAYKQENNIEGFEKTLTQLTTSKLENIQQISTYMLAEHFLDKDANLAVEFIDNADVSKKAFTYDLLQELKAMALVKAGKNEEAKEVFTKLIETTPHQSIKQRAEFKLNQI